MTKISYQDTHSLSSLKQLIADISYAQIPGYSIQWDYRPKLDIIDSLIIIDHIPVIACYTPISKIKNDAITSGALRQVQGGAIADDNISINPFDTNRIATIGLGIEKLISGNTYTVSLPQALQITSDQLYLSVVSIIDSSTGRSWTVAVGDSVNISFSDSGVKYIKLKGTLSNGVILEGKTKFWLDPPDVISSASCGPKHRVIQSDIPVQGYGETEATTTWIDYHIYYRYKADGINCENKLKNPIIITDGFDPLNERVYSKLYNKFLKNESALVLGDSMRRAGFDVIIVNFPVLGEASSKNGIAIPKMVRKQTPTGTVTISKYGRDGGTDDIFRNAMAVVKLIQTVNDSLTNNGSTHQIAIIGPSMGGQITRYALAYMEKQHSLGVPKMQHKCRLWMSYDSPNDGANIALGHQKSFYFFGNVIGAVAAQDGLNKKLLSRAGKQLLIEQLGGMDNSAPERSAFYNQMKMGGLSGSEGYPMNLRKVALANGSGNGTKHWYNGARVIDAYGKVTNGVLSPKLFINQTNFLPNNTTGAFQISRCRGVVFDFLGASMITGSTSLIYHNPRGSMDVVPGSNFDVQSIVKNQFDPYLTSKWVFFQIWNVKRGMTFMPTVSVLGFKNTDFDWNQRVDDRHLVCNNEIHFDYYFVPSTNEEHIAAPDSSIYITNKASDWILQEVMYGKQGCPTICSDNIASTSVVMCSSGSTFTISPAPPDGAVTQWIYDTSAFTEVSSTNSTIKLKPIAGVSSTNDSLIAIIKPAIGGVQCGASKRLVKKMVSPEFFDIHVATPSGIDTNFTATVTPHIPGNTYSWSKDGIVWEANTLSNIDTFRKLVVSSPPYPHFFVKVYNSGCTGALIVLSEQYMVEGFMPWTPKPAKPTTISITPNPTTDHWTISLPANWNNEQSIQYSVVSIDGKEVLNTISPYASSYLLDATQLPKGFYFLKITNGALTEQVKLVKQ